MTSAQGTISAGYEQSVGTLSHRRVADRRRGLLALLAALLVAAMGVTAFGIYTGLSSDRQAASQPTVSQEAIDAYGARWAALGEAHANTISPEAAEAYAARWLALAHPTSQVVAPAAEPLPPGAQPMPDFRLPAGAQPMPEFHAPPGAMTQAAVANAARSFALSYQTPQEITGKALLGSSTAFEPSSADAFSGAALAGPRIGP